MKQLYQKKPVVVFAVHYTGTPESLRDVIDMAGPEWDNRIQYNDDGTLTIKTLEGDMLAQEGDFVIQGVKKEIYPCKPDIFETTYLPVSGVDRMGH